MKQQFNLKLEQELITRIKQAAKTDRRSYSDWMALAALERMEKV